jgi:hypothetical protein
LVYPPRAPHAAARPIRGAGRGAGVKLPDSNPSVVAPAKRRREEAGFHPARPRAGETAPAEPTGRREVLET